MRGWTGDVGTAPQRIKAGTIEFALPAQARCLSGFFSASFLRTHHRETRRESVSYNWLRLMLQEAGVVQKEPARGKYRRQRERRPMVSMLVHLDASTHE